MAADRERSLTNAIDAIESRFHIAGSLKRSLALTVNGSTCEFPMSAGDASTNLAALMAAARPSAFGRNQDTVIDSSVRVAKELAANEFSVNFDPAADGLLAKIRHDLVPDAASVRADLYKLNVMTSGGFFKAHKDTPRGGDTCFGTLVVALPVPFSGGQLLLKHGEEAAALNWGAALLPAYMMRYKYYGGGAGQQDKLQAYVPSVGLQWAAFFGDVEHEIAQVTDGHRITLTYTLHRDAAPNPNADVLLMRASSFYEQMKQALADRQFLPKGGAVGFYCRHLYEETALAQSEAKLSAGGTAAYAAKLKLKNEDAVVAAVLAALGLEVKCLRLLKMDYLEEDYVLDKIPNKKDASHFGSHTCIENAFTALAVTPEDVAGYALGTVSEQVGHEVTWLGSHRAGQRAWVERWYGEYFGNEASTATFYTAAAFVAEVPPFGGRRQLIAKANRTPLTAQHVHAELPAAGGGRGGRKPAAAGRLAVASNNNNNSSAAAAAGSRKRKAVKRDDFVEISDSDEDYEGEDEEQQQQGKRRKQQKHDDELKQDTAYGSDDQDGSEEDYDEEEDDAPAAKRSKAVAATSSSRALAASAVPNLFPGRDPARMTATERKKAELNKVRQIHVTGGRGGRAGDGSCTVQLPPGAGVKELKAILRKKFGKVSQSKMGPLMLVDAATGQQSSTAAKATDLVDGAHVCCTYTHAPGSLGNLMSGGFGGFGPRRGGGMFSFWGF